MSINGYDKTDERSVINHAKKLEGLTMEEIFCSIDFNRPTLKKNAKENVRQFIYKEERGVEHCNETSYKKIYFECAERTSTWYEEILNGKSKNLRNDEKSLIIKKMQTRRCMKCHGPNFYDIRKRCETEGCLTDVKKNKKQNRIQKNKGVVGNIMDEYFCVGGKNDSEPDLPEIETEIKTVPLKEKRSNREVKEPLSLQMIDYDEEKKTNGDIEESAFYKKCSKTLMIVWRHSATKEIRQWKVEDIFIWEIGEKTRENFSEDYKKISKRMGSTKGLRCTNERGQDIDKCDSRKNPCATNLHQKSTKYLTTCPKNPGGDKRAYKIQLGSGRKVESKAFRIKSSYMDKVLEQYRMEKPVSRVLVF